MRGHSRRNITDRNTNPAGFFRRAGNLRQPNFGLNQKIIGLHLGKGARRAITADIAGNQSRVGLPQIGHRNAKTIERPGHQILDKHISLGQHLFENLQIIGLFEIKRD